MTSLTKNVVLFGFLLASCSQEASIELDVLDGTYSSEPCPELSIEAGVITFDDEMLTGELRRIKGENILLTGETIRFTETESGCSLEVFPEPIFNSLKVENQSVSIQLFSHDRTHERLWSKKLID